MVRGFHSSAGFTIVEMLVTVVLAGMFLAFFVQMFRATAAQQTSLVRQSSANDIARSNLSKFPNTSSIPGYTCDSTNDLSSNPNAAGTQILAAANYEPDPGNLGTLNQTVYAFSPQGCSGSHPTIKLVSRVEYGFTGQRDSVEFATYVF